MSVGHRGRDFPKSRSRIEAFVDSVVKERMREKLPAARIVAASVIGFQVEELAGSVTV